MSLANCRLRRTDCGRVLRLSPRPVCLLQTVAYDERAAAGYLGLSTRPVCLLQTVGEPSVLSARTLRTYVPLRAKPKRKRVCKRYTGLGEKALGTLPQPLLKHICKRHTGLGEKALGTLPQPLLKHICKRHTDLGEKALVPCRSPSSSTSARDTQVLSKALGTLPQPLLKHICKRHTGLGEEALGTLPQPRSGNTSARNTRTLAKKPWVLCRSPYPILTPFPASSSSISYRCERQKEWGNYPWSAPGRCRSSLRCSLSCLRVPARPPAPRIRSYATLCG